MFNVQPTTKSLLRTTYAVHQKTQKTSLKGDAGSRQHLSKFWFFLPRCCPCVGASKGAKEMGGSWCCCFFSHRHPKVVKSWMLKVVYSQKKVWFPPLLGQSLACSGVLNVSSNDLPSKYNKSLHDCTLHFEKYRVEKQCCDQRIPCSWNFMQQKKCKNLSISHTQKKTNMHMRHVSASKITRENGGGYRAFYWTAHHFPSIPPNGEETRVKSKSRLGHLQYTFSMQNDVLKASANHLLSE